jgi:transketolase
LAPLAQVLFARVMKHDPADPHWADRDRFVLSAGHASILLYSMLHYHGYDVSLDDIKQFRTFGSRTPGHPEVHHTAGVEVTTGPLGQGLANSVGMAIAERVLRSRFGTAACDHHTFVIAGDGCLEEGISHEAGSLAGHLGLNRLICIYDDNHITIDGHTELSFSDDTAKRFEAYGWHVETLGEIANDCDALEAALLNAKQIEDRPVLLILRSHIGYPSPKFTDNPKAHGDPFPPEEIATVKEILGLPAHEAFYEDAEAVRANQDRSRARGAVAHDAWSKGLAASTGDRTEWELALAGKGAAGWQDQLPHWEAGESVATRNALKKCLDPIVGYFPGLVSGAADLTGNTGTLLAGQEQQDRQTPGGRQIYFGIREHGMAAAMNGMALHGGLIPFGGTFFVFSDYMRPAVRLAAISEAKVVFVWTHDSVGLGQDGPTHQPIEHLASLRAIPGLRLIRPADANETAAAVQVALDSHGPTGLVLSRQDLPVLEGTSAEGLARGAYVLRDALDFKVVLIGTGSEVHVCLQAADLLAASGVAARVVSMPSWDLFEALGDADRKLVLPPNVPAVSVEAGATFGWSRWAQAHVGIDRFGASGPGAIVLEKLGITAEHVVSVAKDLLVG